MMVVLQFSSAFDVVVGNSEFRVFLREARITLWYVYINTYLVMLVLFVYYLSYLLLCTIFFSV